MEANPDDVSDGLLAFLKSLGVNRLSFGVQSFDEKELSFLKRRHSVAGAQAAIEAAMAAGFLEYQSRPHLRPSRAKPGKAGSRPWNGRSPSSLRTFPATN